MLGVNGALPIDMMRTSSLESVFAKYHEAIGGCNWSYTESSTSYLLATPAGHCCNVSRHNPCKRGLEHVPPTRFISCVSSVVLA